MNVRYLGFLKFANFYFCLLSNFGKIAILFIFIGEILNKTWVNQNIDK